MIGPHDEKLIAALLREVFCRVFERVRGGLPVCSLLDPSLTAQYFKLTQMSNCTEVFDAENNHIGVSGFAVAVFHCK